MSDSNEKKSNTNSPELIGSFTCTIPKDKGVPTLAETSAVKLMLRLDPASIRRYTAAADASVQALETLYNNKLNAIQIQLNGAIDQLRYFLQASFPTILFPGPLAGIDPTQIEIGPEVLLSGNDPAAKMVLGFIETHLASMVYNIYHDEGSAENEYKRYFVYAKEGYTRAGEDLIDCIGKINFYSSPRSNWTEGREKVTRNFAYSSNAQVDMEMSTVNGYGDAKFDLRFSNGRSMTFLSKDLVSCPELIEHANLSLALYLENQYRYDRLTEKPLDKNETYRARAVQIEADNLNTLGKLVHELLGPSIYHEESFGYRWDTEDSTIRLVVIGRDDPILLRADYLTNGNRDLVSRRLSVVVDRHWTSGDGETPVYSAEVRESDNPIGYSGKSITNLTFTLPEGDSKEPTVSHAVSEIPTPYSNGIVVEVIELLNWVIAHQREGTVISE